MANDLDKKIQNTAQILKDLHIGWNPHDGQMPVGRALFYDNKKFIFCNCGRKYGKSEILIYGISRWAVINPNSACYYIAPFQKQAKELIWANNRLQNFLHDSVRNKYIESINNSEMRITFKNGSFIKLDGADNYEAYRGINPHFIAYDEFKDHHPQFHVGMEPNLATHNAPCFIIGTPPENDDNHYWRIADSLVDDPDGAYFNMPSETNPHISKEWLEKTRLRLIKRGEEDVWLREYMAQRVYGGRRSIFPMYNSEKMSVPFDYAMEVIRRNRKAWKLYCTADPATSSTFAVLFSAINIYDRRVIHLDEIYEQSTRETSSRKIWGRILLKINEINPDFSEWNFGCDEAAAWFINEVMDITEGEVYFTSTRKAEMKKEAGLSLMKDQMLFGYWRRTDRCEKVEWEIKNYIKDIKEKIMKVNDHLIDCARYTNYFDQYTQVESSEPPVDPEMVLQKRGFRMEEDMREERIKTDWTAKYDYEEEDYYD